MRNRCLNPNDKGYPDYGGRGIRICERWEEFENFFVDMGPRPSRGHSIERKEVNGDYTPDNCIWATRLVQANNKRTSQLITHLGKTQTLSQWCRELGVPRPRIWRRLSKGMDFADAVAADYNLCVRAVTFQGKTLSIPEWSRELGLNKRIIYSRLENGWSVERALTQPKRRW